MHLQLCCASSTADKLLGNEASINKACIWRECHQRKRSQDARTKRLSIWSLRKRDSIGRVKDHQGFALILRRSIRTEIIHVVGSACCHHHYLVLASSFRLCSS